MQSLNLLTVLQYFTGKDWIVPAALSRAQGQLEGAKISPKNNRDSPRNIPQEQSLLQTFLLTDFQSEILTSLQPLCSGQCFVSQENKTRTLL